MDHILSALDRMSDEEKRRVLLKLKREPSLRAVDVEEEGEDKAEGPKEKEKEGGKGTGGSADVEVTLRLHNTWGGTKAIGIEQVSGLHLIQAYRAVGLGCAGCRTCVTVCRSALPV